MQTGFYTFLLRIRLLERRTKLYQSNSGLSEEEIDKMVTDAEENAEQDKARVEELVGAKNTADAMIHSVKASLEEHGEKLDPGEREKVESAIKECEEAVKTEDKGKIQSSSEALTAMARELGELAMAAANKVGDKAQSLVVKIQLMA